MAYSSRQWLMFKCSPARGFQSTLRGSVVVHLNSGNGRTCDWRHFVQKIIVVPDKLVPALTVWTPQSKLHRPWCWQRSDSWRLTYWPQAYKCIPVWHQCVATRWLRGNNSVWHWPLIPPCSVLAPKNHMNTWFPGSYLVFRNQFSFMWHACWQRWHYLSKKTASAEHF